MVWHFKPTLNCPLAPSPFRYAPQQHTTDSLHRVAYYFSRFVLQAIECLRGLLGYYRGDGGATSSDGTRSPSPEAAAAAAAGREDRAKHDGAGGGEATTAADGELGRVAQGRLEWLTQRLRAQLSSELAAALRQADPLAAAAGKGAGTGNGTGGSGGGEEASEVDEERRREGLARVKVTRGGGGSLSFKLCVVVLLFCCFVRTYPLLLCMCSGESMESRLLRGRGGEIVLCWSLSLPALRLPLSNAL